MEAGRFRSGEHIFQDVPVARGVELEPAVAAGERADGLGRLAGDGGERVGDLQARGGAGKMAFGIGPD